jgi:hypothetical protein
VERGTARDWLIAMLRQQGVQIVRHTVDHGNPGFLIELPPPHDDDEEPHWLVGVYVSEIPRAMILPGEG